MALFVPGMSCPLCGQPIKPDEERTLFSPFVANENDPLRVFHDGVFHTVCVRKHPLGPKALAMQDELLKKTAPQNRRCSISGRMITDPDRYLSMGVLTSDPNDPLYRFNFAQFDRVALADWPERKTLAGLICDALASGRMKGKAIEWLHQQIENPLRGKTVGTG
jgi:hypothetical protein